MENPTGIFPVELREVHALELERVITVKGFIEVTFLPEGWEVTLTLKNGEKQVSTKFAPLIPADLIPPRLGKCITLLTRDQTTLAIMIHHDKPYQAKFDYRDILAILDMPHPFVAFGLSGDELKGLTN